MFLLDTTAQHNRQRFHYCIVLWQRWNRRDAGTLQDQEINFEVCLKTSLSMFISISPLNCDFGLLSHVWQTQRMKSLTKEWLSCAMPRRYSVLWNLLQGMISKYVFSVYNIYSFINMALSAAIRELHAGRGPSVTWRMTCTCHAPFSDTPSCRSAFWHWDLQAAKWWELWAFNGLRAILEMIELWNNTVWIASMESIYPAECITKPKGMICMMIVQGGNKIALFRYHITQESRVFVFQRN